MLISGIIRRVALVRTDVSEELQVFLRNVRWLLFTANVVPSSPILVTLMKEALSFSEMSVLTSHKTPFSIVMAVKTSNLTYLDIISIFDPKIVGLPVYEVTRFSLTEMSNRNLPGNES
jgi:hypothetical protein